MVQQSFELEQNECFNKLKKKNNAIYLPPFQFSRRVLVTRAAALDWKGSFYKNIELSCQKTMTCLFRSFARKQIFITLNLVSDNDISPSCTGPCLFA